MVLLRLCAGEGSLVRTEPEAARTRFAQEVQSPNPDLHVLYSFENVQVTFRAEPLEWALAPDPRAGSAGPGRQDQSEAEPEAGLVLGAAQFDELPGMREAELPGVEALRDFVEPEEPDAPDEPDIDQLPDAGDTPVEDARPTCIYCGGSLPTHRPVNFCPHCGQSQTQILCPECRSEVEPGWRHCVNCGAAVGEG